MAKRDSSGRFVQGGGGGSGSGTSSAGGVTIRDRDTGLKDLLKRFAPGVVGVTVGVHESEGSAEHGEATVLDVALFNEFGTEDIPERSFIRAWSDENEEANRGRLKAVAEAVFKKNVPSIEVGLARFGVFCVGDVQKRIASGLSPALAPATVQRKGSSVPLIDTGQLRSSISHKVKPK
jgi:hypothetical protein